MRIGVITFPGSLDDRDALHAVASCGGTPVPLWHADASLTGGTGDTVDAVILPGGFSYGDYLRCGAVAHRAAVIPALQAFARDGGPVLGICNGFQILCEAGLLPGALLRNANLRFISKQVDLDVQADTAWTRGMAGTTITVPLKNGEGRYHADEATLDQLEADGRVVVRYAAGNNFNGSIRDIAGVCNDGGNVVGMMPHPEHAVDAALAGGAGGRGIFANLITSGALA
jgi:phosphoribosylformylglycinamidine synthase I